MELMWSVQYHGKIILTMSPLLNTIMVILGGVIYYGSFYINEPRHVISNNVPF